MNVDILKAYVDLRQKLITEKARLEQRLQEINQALGAKAAVASAAPVAKAVEGTAKPQRRLSAAGRRRIIAATKARWARMRAQQKTAGQPKRKMSPRARAKLAAIARARWAKVKAAGKKAL